MNLMLMDVTSKQMDGCECKHKRRRGKREEEGGKQSNLVCRAGQNHVRWGEEVERYIVDKTTHS